MTSLAHQPVDELRARLLELTEACPVGQCNPADCPLSDLRDMKPRDRLRWFNALSEADLNYLAAYHYVCMKVRVTPDQTSPRLGA